MLVKTSGSFMVLDTFGGQEVNPGEETEVRLTPFINIALGDGRLISLEAGEETPDGEDQEEATPAGDAPADPDVEPSVAPAASAPEVAKSKGPTSGTKARK